MEEELPAANPTVRLIVPAALNNSWIPAGIAVTQSLAPMAMRAMLGMFVTLAANLIGHGIAPPVIGGLSDVFTVHFGNSTDGLRWALIVSAIFYPWAALHFWLASRSIARITRHIMKSAGMPIRPRCATRIRPWF